MNRPPITMITHKLRTRNLEYEVKQLHSDISFLYDILNDMSGINDE